MPERREEIDRLLLDGTTIARPGGDLLELADLLVSLGLVRTSVRTYIRCANPKDRDFPPRNRQCRGRVYLETTLDEPGHDYKCPECERPVFPFRTGKQRFRELQVSVLETGVLKYIGTRLSGAEEITRGVFRVEHDDSCVDVCVIEACEDARYLSPYWNAEYPTLYIPIHGSGAERCPRQLEPHEVLPLAALLCAETTIAKAIKSLFDESGEPLASTPDGAAAAAGSAGAGPRFRPPRTIIHRGTHHDCPDLTKKQTAFLQVALPNAETRVEDLMHQNPSAVWQDKYTGTEVQRDRITKLISRVNQTLLACTPPLEFKFSLRSGSNYVTRLEPQPADRTTDAADNPLTNG